MRINDTVFHIQDVIYAQRVNNKMLRIKFRNGDIWETDLDHPTSVLAHLDTIEREIMKHNG